jgi:hypothetical protein
MVKTSTYELNGYRVFRQEYTGPWEPRPYFGLTREEFERTISAIAEAAKEPEFRDTDASDSPQTRRR